MVMATYITCRLIQKADKIYLEDKNTAYTANCDENVTAYMMGLSMSNGNGVCALLKRG
jgi:hypothetical protein